MDTPFVGIDLGTTYSSIAIYNPDKKTTEVLQIGADQSIPSCVFFGSTREYGSTAKKQLEMHPKAVAFDSKRMIGQTFNEIEQQNFNCPFGIKKSADNDIDIVLEYEDTETIVKPLEVSAEVLKYLRIQAQEKINLK